MVGAPLTPSAENNSRFDGLLWGRAAGTVQCDRPYEDRPYLFNQTDLLALGNDICERCLEVHNLSPPQMTSISGGLVGIAVSVLAEDEHSFITGSKLVYGKNTPSIDFGYQIPQKQIKIDLRDQQLTGFGVFPGKGGIQAIRPIFE
ncbi:hypothetical protein N7507_010024 [Penicillium longicatenatum]|nr:hypothetical protein N7507_010024 [Penicillium longicatenatum]